MASATFESFRQQLIRLRFIGIEEHPGYTALLYDGFLDNDYGYLHVEPGASPPPLHTEVFGSDLVYLRHMGGRWYYAATP